MDHGKHTHRPYEADMQHREVGRDWPAGARPPSPQGLPRQPRRRAQHDDDPHRNHKDCHDTCEDEREPHRDHGDDYDGHGDGHEEMTDAISKDKPIVKKEITTEKVTLECETTKEGTKEEKAEESLGTLEACKRLLEDNALKLEVTAECKATKEKTKEEKAEESLGTREALQMLFEDSAPKLKALRAEAEKLAEAFKKDRKDNGCARTRYHRKGQYETTRNMCIYIYIC